MQRREPIGRRCAAGLELDAFRVARQHVERGAADELRDDRPGLAHGTDGLVDGEFVERRPFGQIGERKQPFDRQRALEHDAVEVGDESPARIDASIADGERQELHEQRTHAPAILRAERFSAAERKDRDHVVRDGAAPVEEERCNLVAQVLGLPPVVFDEAVRGGVHVGLLRRPHVHPSVARTQAT